jgi:ribosomal protein L2
MKARFPIGLAYQDHTEKHKRARRIVDILTTTSQVTGEVVKIEYETEHEFLGQKVRGFANDTRIARSLSTDELRKYL